MNINEPTPLIIGSLALAWVVSCVYTHLKMRQEERAEQERKAALSNGDEVFIVSHASGYIFKAAFVMRYTVHAGEPLERVIASLAGGDHPDVDVWDSEVFTTYNAAEEYLNRF